MLEKCAIRRGFHPISLHIATCLFGFWFYEFHPFFPDDEDAHVEPVHVVDERVPLGLVPPSVRRLDGTQEPRGTQILREQKKTRLLKITEISH